MGNTASQPQPDDGLTQPRAEVPIASSGLVRVSESKAPQENNPHQDLELEMLYKITEFSPTLNVSLEQRCNEILSLREDGIHYAPLDPRPLLSILQDMQTNSRRALLAILGIQTGLGNRYKSVQKSPPPALRDMVPRTKLTVDGSTVFRNEMDLLSKQVNETVDLVHEVLQLAVNVREKYNNAIGPDETPMPDPIWKLSGLPLRAHCISMQEALSRTMSSSDNPNEEEVKEEPLEENFGKEEEEEKNEEEEEKEEEKEEEAEPIVEEYNPDEDNDEVAE
eukprot:TRINITY_DN388_c3_g1_i1.p1 TRINITY_DN388_c3_g1~~TRINITY_DN388_c3_g1_i1.p1  ORF type:complete len:279 (-),score=59.91 TRINITY_DN388_c3_g1_i1:40-876(-)